MKQEIKAALFRYGFPVLIVLLAGILIGGAAGILSNTWLRSAENEKLPEDVPEEGVGRLDAARYLAEKEYTEQTAHRIDIYTAWEGSAPAWFRPWEEMAAEWTDDNAWQSDAQSDAVDYNAHAPVGIDAGGIDWNICTERVGWDGHRAEAWELEVLARVFYREFWGGSDVLCEAGIDAILRLWEKQLYGRTLGETLAGRNENGSYAFSTYPYIWCDDYDAAGLDWCRAYTAERFAAGPEWIAEYFRLDGYHDWGEWSPTPAYEIDGVYFSVGVR